MRLGLFLPVLEGWLGDAWLPRWPELRALARQAEAVGFDALFLPDHLVMRGSRYWGISEGETRGIWEAWTLLAALAEATTRVALGSFVTPTGFRNPALLAKMAATVDELSGGRLILGLGCGTPAAEYAAFGVPGDHLVSRFEEALRIIVPLLRDGRVDFEGRYYTARDCELSPRGPRPGGPPIWIAALRPRMLELAAQWGDGLVTAWHARPDALDEPLAEQPAVARLDKIIGTIVSLGVGARLPREVLRGSTEELAARLDAFRVAGVDYLVCMLEPRGARGLERFTPVIEALRRPSG